ncbi:MAG: PDR/VanB family oxidoreductase [Microbacteriaceae bacterium]
MSTVERDLVVVSAEHAAVDVLALGLAAADGSSLPSWQPGSHIDLLLPTGVERQYSLSGDPADSSVWRIGVLRESDGRGGSEWIHRNLVVGAAIRSRGPSNHFIFAPDARVQFIAGGIGITPLLPMIRAAEAAGIDWRLSYAARTRARMAFLDELSSYGPRVRLHIADENGRLDLPMLLDALPRHTHLYSCGPAGLLDEVERLAATRAPGHSHMERFEPKVLSEPVLREAFEVELLLSGRTLTVPEDRSILEVVEEAGVFVLSSCREGTCGTCETAVIDGEVDHRDSILSADEQRMNDRMMICVSRSACPRLTLEL